LRWNELEVHEDEEERESLFKQIGKMNEVIWKVGN
jgi:hypothetical protein